ncbi:DUF2167 domain-containing protein [Taklimakanibacter lacteus]|uniref:DUF2167 domain-containing protein n=1 Tax=Taklimakanibacter lacteus TaxID=2268456 RepID=UPI000E665552
MALHLLRVLTTLALLAASGTSGALAQTDQSTTPSELQLAYETAIKAATNGPADVALRDLATIRLDDPYSFIPVKEGAALMRAFGNSTHESFIGLIIPKQDPFWFVTINYTDSGHIADSEAKTWNADELLQSLKDGTEAANKERMERGVPAFDVVGWAEKPTYDEATHRLVWSIIGKDRGVPQNGSTINYNTYALGRQGYFELNLVTSEEAIATDKKHAGVLLAALDYKPGQRYSDFDASTDRVAEYGIAALIGGIAAKKLGLLAVIGVALAKFWKIILIAVAVAGGGVFKLFGRRKSTPEA